MTFKNKLTLAVLGLVIFIMLVSTLIVSFTVRQQNMGVSTEALKNAFTIIEYQMSDLKTRMLTDTRQIITASDMVSELSLIESYKQRPDGYTMTRSNHVKIIEGLYSKVSTGAATHMCAFDSAGDLVAFVGRDKETLVGLYPYKADGRPVFQMAVLEKGDAITEDLFKIVDQWPFDASLLKTGIVKEDGVMFKGDKDSLNITAHAAVIEERVDFRTKKKIQNVLGMVAASKIIGADFAARIATFSSTDVMIFSKAGAKAGTLDTEMTFSFDALTDVKKSIDVGKQKILRDETVVGKQGYARGILPVKEDGRDVGAIVALHSKAVASANTNQIIKFLSISAFVCILFVLPLVFWFAGSMTKPIQKVVTGLEDIAQGEGDLTVTLDIQSKGEIGELARWFNLFINKLKNIISDVKDNSGALDASSDELSDLSGQMSGIADNMSARCSEVAASTSEMSNNLTTIAAAMEETSTSVNLVATATEQMNTSVNEISGNSSKAREIAEAAVEQTRSVSESIESLGKTASEISSFVESITDISGQTNLLALNATIEASRAGEAGRGFAVVAGEIKALAGQTAGAALEIKEKIAANQDATKKSVEEIERVTGIIHDIHGIISTIAAAVEEQSSTTREIADNVTQMSRGIQEVNENVSQSADAAEKIAGDISGINKDAATMSASGTRVSGSADDLSKLAAELQKLVSVFKV